MKDKTFKFCLKLIKKVCIFISFLYFLGIIFNNLRFNLTTMTPILMFGSIILIAEFFIVKEFKDEISRD